MGCSGQMTAACPSKMSRPDPKLHCCRQLPVVSCLVSPARQPQIIPLLPCRL